MINVQCRKFVAGKEEGVEISSEFVVADVEVGEFGECRHSVELNRS